MQRSQCEITASGRPPIDCVLRGSAGHVVRQLRASQSSNLSAVEPGELIGPRRLARNCDGRNLPAGAEPRFLVDPERGSLHGSVLQAS